MVNGLCVETDIESDNSAACGRGGNKIQLTCTSSKCWQSTVIGNRDTAHSQIIRLNGDAGIAGNIGGISEAQAGTWLDGNRSCAERRPRTCHRANCTCSCVCTSGLVWTHDQACEVIGPIGHHQEAVVILLKDAARDLAAKNGATRAAKGRTENRARPESRGTHHIDTLYAHRQRATKGCRDRLIRRAVIKGQARDALKHSFTVVIESRMATNDHRAAEVGHGGDITPRKHVRNRVGGIA